MRLGRDGRGNINTAAAVVRSYKSRHASDGRRLSSCAGIMMPRNLALKNRQLSASGLAQVLSVEVDVSVTDQSARRTMHDVNFLPTPRRKPLLKKLQD